MKVYFSTLYLFLLFSLVFLGCEQEKDTPVFSDISGIDLTSQQEVIETIDNLMRIADYAFAKQGTRLAPALSVDNVYVRGKADGSIETETHKTVKGAPLISVRLTRGNSDLSTHTITRTYDSEEDFTRGVVSTEKITAVIGLASGQIKTTVNRDDTQLYNTFRTPVITIKQDITTTRQGALEGSIEVVRTQTTDGSLISRTLIYGQADGAIVTKRIYADKSWQIAAIKGKPDESIEKTITTSDPTPVTLNAPTNVTDSSMILSWTENTDSNFARYEIYQSLSSGVSMSDTLAGSIEEQTTTEFTVEGLSSQTTYYFRLYVINDIEQAAGSNKVGATTN